MTSATTSVSSRAMIEFEDCDGALLFTIGNGACGFAMGGAAGGGLDRLPLGPRGFVSFAELAQGSAEEPQGRRIVGVQFQQAAGLFFGRLRIGCQQLPRLFQRGMRIGNN